MESRFLGYAICAASVLHFAQPLPAMAAAEAVAVDATSDIGRLTESIADKELELLRLNTNLKLVQLPRSPWGQRAWAFSNLSNVTLTATGAFINGCTRFSYLHKVRLKRAPKEIFIDAGWCRVTANMITTGSGLIATSCLAASDILNHSRGVDLGTMRKYADKLQGELDGLLSKREAAVKERLTTPNEKALMEAEGTVLRDVRNLAVNEFVRYYSGAKGNKAAAYVGYLWAAASNANAGAGGITANVAGNMHHGTKRYRTRLAGVGGICDIVSGSMNFATPVVTRSVGHLVGHVSKASITRELDAQEPAQLDALHQHETYLRTLAGDGSTADTRNIVDREAIYSREVAVFDEHEKIRIGDKAAARRKLTDQMIFFTGIGPPKFINGIGGAVAAYHFTNDKPAQFRTIGYCATVYGAGYCMSAAELIRNQVNVERNNHKARTGHSQRATLQKELVDIDHLLAHTDSSGKQSN